MSLQDVLVVPGTFFPKVPECLLKKMDSGTFSFHLSIYLFILSMSSAI